MEDHDNILTRYRRMRTAARELNKALPGQLSRPVIKAAARKLGCWVDGAVVMDDIDQTCVLMDYAIYDCPEGGRNAVERYAAEHPPAPGTDAEAALAAMKKAFYSLFQVRRVVRGVGVRVWDILRDQEHLLADLAFSETTVEGVVLATRVLPFDDFIMTAGAGLPVDADILEIVGNCLRKGGMTHEQLRILPRDAWRDFAATVIRACLNSDAGQRIRYQNEPGAGGEPAASRESVRVGRNDPCPCGSGKKFKKCCGR